MARWERENVRMKSEEGVPPLFYFLAPADLVIERAQFQEGTTGHLRWTSGTCGSTRHALDF